MTDSDERRDNQADTHALETLGAAALMSATPAGRRVVVFGPSKPLALIVYLASVPGGSATREFLIDLLWADLDPEAARHAFRQTLWYIKQKTGRALIRATGETVTLAESIPSDRSAFVRAVEQREFEVAVSLYHGDFLPDFAAPGGLQFEHWADLERQRLRDTFTRSTEHVIRHCLSTARYREAVTLARRARDVNPLSENAWRLLIESLVSANDALGASLEADALQKMLAEEDRQPEPATRSMLRTARQLSSEPTAAGTTPAAIVAELVGREAEFSTLLAAWDEAKSGTARKVSIVGGAGIGKTRLVTDVVARLRATRARVVWVRANPGEREIAYAFMSKLAGALAALPGAAAVSPASAGALVALNPTLSGSFNAEPDRAAGPEALRHRTIAVHELLAAAADEAPIAVIVDDLHWADRDSARAFSGVTELLERERVLLIAAARPSNGGTGPAPRDATVIRLSPLTAADTGALLASVGSLPESDIAQRIPLLLRDASNGVPLLVIETLQFLMDQKLLALDAGSWKIADEPALVRALNAGGALRRRIEALDAAERSALNAVALAGVPVPAGFVGDVVQRPLPDVAAILYSLEMHGMVNHVGDGWEPVHDQIGELALSGLDAAVRRAAELAVGRAWLHGDFDDHALRRAGMHFSRAGDRAATAHAFATWVRRLRRVGDHRAAQALAAEFIDSEDEQQIRELVRRLPFQFRYATTRWRTAAVIAFVAVASAAATWQWARPPEAAPDEQFLAVSVDSSGDTSVYRVGVRRDRWTGGDLIMVPKEGRRIHLSLPSAFGDYALTPDGKAWVSWATMPDSGGNEVMLESMAGGRQRLTWTPGDDQGANPSPDGRQIAFATGRYDALSHAHLAIMDLATHSVRQLTGGSGSEGGPRWSPSGVLIAFAHFTLSDAPDSLCTIAPDGSLRRCFITDGVSDVRGWIDDNRVLVTVQRDSSIDLDVLDVRDGSRQRIQRVSTGLYLLSPDGKWVYCDCREAATSRDQAVIFPLERPDLARPVAMNALDRRPMQILWPSPRPAQYVTRLSTPLPANGVSVGAAYKFPTFGITADGRQLSLPTAAMTSLDPGVVTIGPENRVIAVGAGTARIAVTAGGWRTDTISLRVAASRDSVVLHDDWSRGIEPDFVPFGEPAPIVTKDSSGHAAFWNHGDGSFMSGAYSRHTYDATNGLGMETTLSMPLNMGQWQDQDVALQPMRDSAALARWDHRSGYAPFGTDGVRPLCAFSYPALEGTRSIHAAQILGAFTSADHLAAKPLYSGHPFRVRLQVFPDGRCGVAIDGRPVAIASLGALPHGKYFLELQGQSYHTRILTGPVDIWTGIRPGVDWLAFDTAQVKPRHRGR